MWPLALEPLDSLCTHNIMQNPIFSCNSNGICITVRLPERLFYSQYLSPKAIGYKKLDTTISKKATGILRLWNSPYVGKCKILVCYLEKYLIQWKFSTWEFSPWQLSPNGNFPKMAVYRLAIFRLEIFPMAIFPLAVILSRQNIIQRMINITYVTKLIKLLV